MSILAHLSFFSFTIYIFLGLYAYLLEPKQKLNKIFLLLCLCFAIWALGYTFVYCPPVVGTELFWAKLSTLGWGAFSSIILHISLELTSNKLLNKPWIFPLIYLPGFTVIFYELFLYGNLSTILYGMFDKLYFYFNALYYTSFCAASLYLIWSWGKKQSTKREKRQAIWIVSSGTLALFLGFLVQTLLPALGIHKIPLISHILILILAFGIWVAIARYRLLRVTSILASDEIISLVKDLLILTDSNGYILQVNKRFEEVLGYCNASMKGCHISSLANFSVSEIAAAKDHLSSSNHFETPCRSQTGEPIPLSFSVSPMKDRLNEVIGYVFVAQDIRQTRQLQNEINERKKIEEQLLYTSMHDSLTGLLNRRSFELDLIHFNTVPNLGLIIIDIDGLKIVNDTLGHLKGDDLIKQSAHLIAETLNDESYVYRIGGDEFAVIMKYNMPSDVENTCSKLRAAMELHNRVSSSLPLSISIGFSYRCDVQRSISEIFSEADSMMYRNKLEESSIKNFDLVSAIANVLDNPNHVTPDNVQRLMLLVNKANEILDVNHSLRH